MKRLMIEPTMDVSSFLRGLPGGQALNSAKDRLLASGARARLNKLIEVLWNLARFAIEHRRPVALLL